MLQRMAAAQCPEGVAAATNTIEIVKARINAAKPAVQSLAHFMRKAEEAADKLRPLDTQIQELEEKRVAWHG
eukprot:149380-Alexandrium_andersonii.AAC.1